MTNNLTLTQQTILTTIDTINRAESLNIEPAIVFAFCEIESSFNPNAYRYEERLQEASYGLMQLLYSTACDRGLTDDPKTLWKIDANLQYGMRQLAWIRDYIEGHSVSDPSPADLAACYNAGVGNFLHGLLPQRYIDTFTKSYERWKVTLNSAST